MKKIITITLLLVIGNFIWGQSNSLYFTKNIYQSTQLNPARTNDCRIIIGLPILSEIHTTLANRGISYKNLFSEMKNTPDSFYIDLENIYNNLSKNNYLILQNKFSLGSLGFWIQDFYITLDASIKNQTVFAYPKSMFLIKDGNYFTDEKGISMSNLAFDEKLYTEMSLGIAKEIMPGLTIGGKIKYLTGYANAYIGNTDINWKVSTKEEDIYDYEFDLSADVKYAGAAHISPQYNENNRIDSLAIQNPFENYKTPSTFNDIIETKKLAKAGTGVGFDIGAIYNLNDKIEFSVAATDIGFISWKKNPLTLTIKDSKFKFPGLDPGKYLSNEGLSKNIDSMETIINKMKDDLIDSIMALTSPKIDSVKYKTPLNTNIRIAAAYTPYEWLTVGALYNGYLFNKKIISSYTLTSTLMFWRGWSYTLTYTMFNKSMNNIGMGLALKLGPIQAYLVADNISIPFFAARYAISPDKSPDKGFATNWVKNTKFMSINIGINFTFGCRSKYDYGIID